MLLKELSTVAPAALPLAAFKEHLRLGTGFADDTVQDALAEGYLRAALAAIEGRTAKVLLARDFALTLRDWRDPAAQTFPLAPVAAVLSVTLRDRDGLASIVSPARYRLERDLQRPRLAGAGGLLPGVPVGGEAEVAFTAGFGDWAAVPADLQQAVLLLAAQYHEHRHDMGQAGLPGAVAVLIERWRTVRVLGGGAA